MKIPYPLAQGFYTSESLPLSAQACINFFPSIPETRTITDANIFGTPGLEFLADATDPNRGAHEFGGVPYFVNGTRLFRLNLTFDALGAEIWELVDVGEIPGEKRVFMANNDTQMCIVTPEDDDQFNTYILDSTDTVIQVSDVAFLGPAASVIFSNGFFLFVNKDGDKLFKSAHRNGLAYNALDSTNAESDPDKNQSLVAYRNQVMVFGTKTMEGFQITPTGNFPYISSGVVEQKGLIAPATLTEVEGSLYWLGSAAREKPQILVYSGGVPQRISTRAIENAIKQLSRTEQEEAFSWDYSENGSDFIAFTFPSTTFVYDLSTGLWHERKSKAEDGDLVAFRASNIIEAYSFLLTGDIYNGNIGRLSTDVMTEYGVAIERDAIMAPLDNRGERTFVNQFELVAENGVALLPNQQGDEAEIRLSWSDDGGRTFFQVETESLGLTGDYTKRIQWRNHGSFDRSRMYRLQMSDPVKVSLIKVELDIDS